ncbi:hypothetical protein [Flavobacterium stagni]|uniref:Uncharacterized protein n=1 Tax=Flavobacterium stagni TaxID=2506421 RepID=A0A4Q1KCT2_9FLAO|nr:hypothetical protein [Flavobacterium stagni]RXR23039.1 hypothetical protein EQG61_07325 [Flavobacterium stagni]
MEKITVKELIEFREKTSDKSKKNYAQKLKFRKPKEKAQGKKKGGGNYWSISNSCIQNVFKDGTEDYYDLKIDDAIISKEIEQRERFKTMYQRNIDILSNFKEFDILNLRPENIQNFESIHKEQRIVEVNKYPIYLNPNLVFSFERNGKKEIGALLLISQIDGYKKSQLGMFCEMLYRFLELHFSNDYQIAEDYCITIDTCLSKIMTYTEISDGTVPSLIKPTIEEIKKL